MQRLALAFLAISLASTPAWADCDHFKWSVARELGWFKASPATLPAQGGEASLGAGYALSLAPDVKFPIPPERPAGKDSYAAVVTVPKLDAGQYQVTLSEEAWVDVAQNGALVKSGAYSGQHDCPGVRKTVRFVLAAGATTLQISNSASEHLNFAISPSP